MTAPLDDDTIVGDATVVTENRTDAETDSGTCPDTKAAIRFMTMADRLTTALTRAVPGKDGPARLCVAAALAGGHILVEDAPGTGKTRLAVALADSLGVGWSRIQFTADLLPGDITGTLWFDQSGGSFRLRKGPVFSSVVLADEINRAGPRTQSALLEVMEENAVSIDGASYRVPEPFIVIATQNPRDRAGVYPLPDAQLDRFMIRIGLGYPSHTAAVGILLADSSPSVSRQDPVDVVTAAQLDWMRTSARTVHIADAVADYIVTLTETLRADRRVEGGPSIRGMLAWTRLCRVWAAMHGRTYVTPTDVSELAVPTLAHRLSLTDDARYSDVDAAALVSEALDAVPVPCADAHAAATRTPSSRSCLPLPRRRHTRTTKQEDR